MLITKRDRYIVFILCFLLINISGSVRSQEKETDNYPRGAQYFLGTGEELLIRVNIWGFVNKPGQYMVPSETDLISLISYAGGPKNGAKMSSVKIVRIYEQDGNKEKVIAVNVNKYLKNGNQKLIPFLKPDDTILIYGSKWFHLNTVLEFVTKLAMLAQIYSWIMYYQDR